MQIDGLILVKPNMECIEEIRTYRQECLDHDGGSHGDTGLADLEDIEAWITRARLCEHKDTLPNPDWVTADQYMLMRPGEGRILGMINLRHYLNAFLAEYGGHIGFGVRPTERRKGYAGAMLMMCLEKCRQMGLDRVLLTCDASNEASRRTIKACGGVFERVVKKDGAEDTELYWIDLT